MPERGELQGGVYLRISEDREGDELGIDRHFEDLLAVFQARKWALDRRHVFVDNDLSAAGKRDRPDFVRMMHAIEAGELRVVTAWMLDRFLRNRRDQVWLYEECEKAGMVMAFARGADLDMTTATGQQVADHLAAAARGEIKVKGERHRRAQEQAAKQGRRVGGRKAFGYELNGMELIPEESAAIKQGYADLLAGVPLAQIGRDWNAAGLFSGQTRQFDSPKGPQGSLTRWTHDTVRLVLLNPRNAGIRRYRGEEVGPALWPEIVSEETFRAAQALLNDASRYSGARAEQQLLTAVALCGVKGCELTVHGGGASHGKPVYRCTSGKHVNRMAAPVDEFVSMVAVERLKRPDARELLVDYEKPNIGELLDEVNAKRTRLEQVAVEFADDDTVTPAQLRAATARLRSRIAEIEAQLADAGRVDILGPLVQADNVDDAWEAMNTAKRRAVIDTLMVVRLHLVGRGTRTFRPETVAIKWRDEGTSGRKGSRAR